MFGRGSVNLGPEPSGLLGRMIITSRRELLMMSGVESWDELLTLAGDYILRSSLLPYTPIDYSIVVHFIALGSTIARRSSHAGGRLAVDGRVRSNLPTPASSPAADRCAVTAAATANGSR